MRGRWGKGAGVVVWFSPVIHVETPMMVLSFFFFSIEVDKMLNGKLMLMLPPIPLYEHAFKEEDCFYFIHSCSVCVCLGGFPVICSEAGSTRGK